MHSNGLPRKFNALPFEDFAGLTHLNSAIDFDFPLGYGEFCSSPAVAEPSRFEKLMKLNKFCMKLKRDLLHREPLRGEPG